MLQKHKHFCEIEDLKTVNQNTIVGVLLKQCLQQQGDIFLHVQKRFIYI